MNARENLNHEFKPGRLLDALPAEIVAQVLARYLDGKALSTLYLALCTYRFDHRFRLQNRRHLEKHRDMIPSICKDRLLKIADFVSDRSQDNDEAVPAGSASMWIVSVVTSRQNEVYWREQDNLANRLAAIRFLSEYAALLDFLHCSIELYSQPDRGRFEWPIWVGRISIDSFDSVRLRHSASVLLTSPMARPTFVPGFSRILHHVPAASFRVEPFNIVPLPPWGRLRGLTPQDERVLRPVARLLRERQQVGIPSSHLHQFQSDVLDVRILSTEQAQGLITQSRLLSRRTSWILAPTSSGVTNCGDDMPNDRDDGLICCWQEESTDDNNNNGDNHDRLYLDYIIHLMRAQKRVLRSGGAPSGREFYRDETRGWTS